MKNVNLILGIMLMGTVLFLPSCSNKDSKKSIVADEDMDKYDIEQKSDFDMEYYNSEWTPPEYCNEKIAYIPVRDLPRSMAVDCLAQCNARLKCEWEWAGMPTDTSDYQRMMGLCVSDCGRRGSYDYSQFVNCDDMKKKIEELIWEYIDTSTWKDCQPSKGGAWNPDKTNPCYITCDSLFMRCPEKIKILSAGARGEGVTDMQMCFGACTGKFKTTQYDIVKDAGVNLSCDDVECFIRYSCQWPPEDVGDYDAVDEPAKIDYEVTP